MIKSVATPPARIVPGYMKSELHTRCPRLPGLITGHEQAFAMRGAGRVKFSLARKWLVVFQPISGESPGSFCRSKVDSALCKLPADVGDDGVEFIVVQIRKRELVIPNSFGITEQITRR